ncbi:MAG: hypothetical protein GXP48_02160 [Acidobacteria bacterium]|nr:hypothetical protein [Acidobacteriota bacterium]
MRRLAWLLVAAGALAGACTVVHHAPSAHEGAGVRLWPAEHPRIELVRVLGVRGDLRGGGLLRWLRGGRKDPLFARPYGVAWDGEALLVADPGAARVLRIAPGGGIRQSKEGLFVAPVALAACEGGIVVTDPAAGSVALLDRDLRLSRWLARDLQRPTGVACVGPHVYVLETGAHRLVEIRDQAVVPVLGGRGDGPGQFNFPTALTADGSTLWVGDTLNFRVVRVDPASRQVLETFGTLGDSPGEMPRLKGLAVDREGRLWISDGLLDQIALYTRGGTYLMSIGRHGSAPGELSFPAGLATGPHGRVVVADSLNRRLQVFAPVPTEAMP